MKPTGLSVILFTAWIAVAGCFWGDPAVAQDQPLCSAMVTVVDDQGAAVPVGHTISLLFSQVDLREQVTDGVATTYTFEGLPCGKTMAVVGTGEVATVEMRAVEALVTKIVTLEPGITSQVLLAIPAMTQVTVTALDGAGVPAAGGTVIAIPDGAGTTDRTSARFVLLSPEGVGVLKVPPGRYLLQPSFPEGQQVEKIVVDGVDLHGEEAIEVGDLPRDILIVVTSAEKITGVVTDEGGAPISSYQVIVKKPGSHPGSPYPILREDGRFAVSTPAFPVEVLIHDSDGEWTFEPVSMQVQNKEQAIGLHFTGRRFDGGKLRGRVLAGDPVAPVARAFINSRPNCYSSEGTPSIARPVQVMADEEGEFELPCFAGCYTSLEISEPRSEEYLPLTWYGSPEDCNQKRTFVLEKGNIITGVVSDTGGDPVDRLVISTMTRGMDGITDEEGNFRITNLGSGRYELQVKSWKDAAFSPFILLPDASGNRPAVTFSSTGETERLELEVTLGGSVCLDLEDETGQPVEVDYLELVLPGENHPAKVASRHTSHNKTRTDALCVGPLAPGDYHLRAGNRFSWFLPAWWPGTEDREEAVLISILAGDRLEIGPMTTRRAGPVQINIKQGFFLDQPRPFPEFRTVVEKTTPEEKPKKQKWDPVDPDELYFLAKREGQNDEGRPTFGAIRFAPYPVGRYDVRVCEIEGCKEGNVWCSPKPLVVEKRKGGEIELVLSEDPECKPVSEIHKSP